MGIDLTASARAGTLDPVIGRHQEIERVIQILSRRTKNNPALIGEPGVGKSAIVDGLAQRLVAGEVPETLAGKRLLTLDVGSLVAGTKYRGEFEERLKKIIGEIRNSRDCIIFIDEVHTLVGAGAAEGAVDAANILKPALAPLNLKEAMKGLESVLREKEQAIQQQEYELAAELRDREVKLRDRIAKLESGWHRERGSEKPSVGEEEIAQIVSMWTGIPVMRIAQEESQRLLQMEDALHSRVIAQDEAIEKVSRAVRRARAGLKDPKRPIGSFIFMGPTGVGKTELARALAEFMFGSEEALIKIDMSEFMERHAAARLVGAPPGYVGYEEGGQLTEAVRRKSYSVILLDEIEKAHPDVFNMLLQILEDGKLTDAKGRTVDFRNTIVIMTSNVGAALLNKEASIGFKQSKDKAKANQSEYESMKGKVLGELKNTFKPEFLNRIDEVIVFHSLRIEEMYSIVELLLNRVRVQLTEQQIELIVPQATKDFLIDKGFDPQYGARPLRRTIQRMVEDPLAEGLLQGKFHPGDLVEASIIDDDLVLQVRNRIEQLPAPATPEAALSAGGDTGASSETLQG